MYHSKVIYPWPPSLLFLPFNFLSLSLFFSLSRLCQCVTGFLPTFFLSCVRAVLLVINYLLLYSMIYTMVYTIWYIMIPCNIP